MNDQTTLGYIGGDNRYKRILILTHIDRFGLDNYIDLLS